MPFTSELALATLRALGEWQGTRVDDFRDEDPGRIMHEMRYGEMTAFEERPHSPYYGGADATPLYVVLLDEYERWTGDTKLVRDLEVEARAALAWIDDYADLQGNGYIWYQRRNEQTGLENQCWKDSPDSISYRDGRLPGFPRATAEQQGYAYDAKMRGARLARLIWRDAAFADRLERRRPTSSAASTAISGSRTTSTSRSRSTPRASRSTRSPRTTAICCGAASSTSRRPRPSPGTSSGPRLFSGWGVRTLAEGEARYNPIGYHVGTVWPFDNSFIAWGLRRYGFKDEAALIAAGILDAAEFFDGRLPEAFGGYEREQTNYPVEYPTACSPQAWSTGAPLLFLRTMLGLEPIGEHLIVDPAFPADRAGRAAGHPRTLGPHRRFRARAQADGEGAIREASTWSQQGMNP